MPNVVEFFDWMFQDNIFKPPIGLFVNLWGLLGLTSLSGGLAGGCDVFDSLSRRLLKIESNSENKLVFKASVVWVQAF